MSLRNDVLGILSRISRRTFSASLPLPGSAANAPWRKGPDPHRSSPPAGLAGHGVVPPRWPCRSGPGPPSPRPTRPVQSVACLLSLRFAEAAGRAAAASAPLPRRSRALALMSEPAGRGPQKPCAATNWSASLMVACRRSWSVLNGDHRLLPVLPAGSPRPFQEEAGKRRPSRCARKASFHAWLAAASRPCHPGAAAHTTASTKIAMTLRRGQRCKNEMGPEADELVRLLQLFAGRMERGHRMRR